MKKVILKSMLLFVAILFVGIAQAQTVTGTVTEENGPLPGANVIVKGTSNGVTTDFDGNYSLNNVPSDATLVFSYVGFSTQEVAVGGRSVVNVSLATDNALDEVVLIGYGSTTIKDATGSVDNVGAEDFNQGVIQTPEQLIQGKTAGVQISESSGEPGGGVAIRIRGNNSIRSGNNPLFVVDGVPLAGGGAPGVNTGGIAQASGGNPLSFINPNDIESISILKDASATAIYGSRGANGVIIVQTKGGRGASKGVWELNSSVSSSKAAQRYDLLNRAEYLEAIADLPNTPLLGNADTDWQDVYLRNSFSRQTDLSYSKSYNGGNVRASFGYGNNNGVVENSSIERISGRLNFSQKFFDNKLTVTGTGSVSRINRETAPLNGSAGSRGDIIGASISTNPTYPLNEEFFEQTPGIFSPVNYLNSFQGLSESDRILANLSLDYDVTEELSAKVTVGYDRTESNTTGVIASSILNAQSLTGIGRGDYNINNNENKLFEATLNYKKDLGNVKLDFLGGFSYQEFQRDGIFSNGAGFNTTNLADMRGQLIDQYNILNNVVPGNAQVFGYGNDGSFLTTLLPEVQTGLTLPAGFAQVLPAYIAGRYDNADELQSYFARANVTISEKFLFTGTFRIDGSSTFGEDERYARFPSGAFAWKLDEEDFIGDNISTLKLRLGAGVVGSQEGLGYGLFTTRNVAEFTTITDDLNVIANGEVIPGIDVAGDVNSRLKWEETTDFNVGIDFGFNDDRFNGSFNLYRKETNDLLLLAETAAPSNVPTAFGNLDDGTVVNQGIELALNYDFINTDDFSFNAAFNIAYNENEVQDTNRVIPTGAIRGNGLTGAFAQQLEAGQPLFSFYMAEFTGFDANGEPTYLDINGDGEGDPDSDKFFVGENAVPKVTSGLSLSARYKNFDLSTYFNGQFGFSVYNATNNAFFTKSALIIGQNITQDAANSAETAGGVAVSTRFLEKGDFVRLQSASLGYNWPLSGEGMFDSLRLSLTGQNLFLITGYSGLDPEVSSDTGSLNASAIPTAGIDYAPYPRARTFTLGVNARF
nr:TonB-dependent receptor [uncultured bacterium]